jgi:hypothetical protein
MTLNVTIIKHSTLLCSSRHNDTSLSDVFYIVMLSVILHNVIKMSVEAPNQGLYSQYFIFFIRRIS